MDRRHFIQNSSYALGALLFSEVVPNGLFSNTEKTLITYPDSVSAILGEQVVQLKGSGAKWIYNNLTVTLEKSKTGIQVFIRSPNVSLEKVILNWITPDKTKSTVLNDHWERTYGDISWHPTKSEEMLPWYFMEIEGDETFGFGVKTGTNSFCSWNIGINNLALHLDTRSGGNGVKLGDRKLKAAEIVTISSNTGETVFQTTQRFMGLMCPVARMPADPVYGINDWYFSYGNNSEKLILEHTSLMSPMAEGLNNKPFSVIDAGWFATSPYHPDDRSWGNVGKSNEFFPDMAGLASKIRDLGMRPGLWTRPLCGKESDNKNLFLPINSGNTPNMPVLDPSIPENLETIAGYFKLYNEWNYDLVKFDYTTFDIFGNWGFQMMQKGALTQKGWHMNDVSKTNAEIILGLYKTIKKAAGNTYIIACNTFSHLSAGIFEISRIGDDTSGNEWDRTLKMGVNTLAFRGLQHGKFYASDADCVGLTTKVPWEKNKQWMELVAKSGTPLFISAQPDAIGSEQKETIKKCFELASKKLPVGEPLDWLTNAFPNNWKLNGKNESFNW